MNEFYIQDLNGACIQRFIRLEDRWLGLQQPWVEWNSPIALPGHLGVLMPWQSVLTHLAKLAKRDESYSVSGEECFALGPVMRVSELSRLLGVDAEAVRAELEDYVITVTQP